MESMTDTKPHPSSRRYPAEIKERAVRMVVDTIERGGEQPGAVCVKLGMERIGPAREGERRLGLRTQRWRSFECCQSARSRVRMETPARRGDLTLLCMTARRP